MAFVVYENDKRADCWNFAVDYSWNNSSFDTKEEAIAYAKEWLGDYAPQHDWQGEKYSYSGYGDFIEIREES